MKSRSVLAGRKEMITACERWKHFVTGRAGRRGDAAAVAGMWRAPPKSFSSGFHNLGFSSCPRAR